MTGTTEAVRPRWETRNDVNRRVIAHVRPELDEHWHVHRTSCAFAAPLPKFTRLLNPRVKQEFEELARVWKRETAISSNLTKIVLHPAYQRIMAMGPAVIPLILEDLSRKPAHWFWALHNLVPPGKDPAKGLTNIRAATDAWVKWGKEEGYL